MAVKIHAKALWVVLLCSVMIGRSCRWRQQGALEYWYPIVALHDIRTHKTSTSVTESSPCVCQFIISEPADRFS
jgi:hypothetical protein